MPDARSILDEVDIIRERHRLASVELGSLQPILGPILDEIDELDFLDVLSNLGDLGAQAREKGAVSRALLRLVGLFVLVFTSTGCAGTIQGQVVDAQTGQPIEGAVVLGFWEKQREQEVETNTHGRFTLDWPSDVPEDAALVIVYKFGYVVWNNYDIFDPRDPSLNSQPRPDRRVPARINLEPFPPDGNRARHVWLLSFLGGGDGNQRRRPKLWNAIQSEVEAARRQSGKDRQ